MIGTQRAPCETPSAIPPNGRDPHWVLPTSILGSSLGLIDSSVVNVALPRMQAELGTGFVTSQWIVNSIRLTNTCRRSRPSGSYRKYGSSTRQYNWFLSLCSHLWSLFLIRGSRHEVHAHSASLGSGDVLAAIRDTRNRRAGAPFWLCIMRASRGHRADSGLRHRTRSRDRAVAPGATPLAPETGRGRHPLALMSTWRRSRPCASCNIWNSPGSSSCAALRSTIALRRGLKTGRCVMGQESTLCCHRGSAV